MASNALQDGLRTLREIQAPQQISAANDRDSGYRVSSAAFMPGSDKTVSVDLEEEYLAAGIALNSRFPSLPRAVALVSNTVASIRAKQLDVKRDPLPHNAFHGIIVDGASPLGKKARREAARMLADECEFVVAFDLAEIAKQATGA